MAKPKPDRRFRRELLLLAEIDFTGHDPTVKSISWNTADLIMRRFAWVWIHADPFKKERGPNLVGVIPEMVPRNPYTGEFKPAFPSSGSIHKQYEPRLMHKQYGNPDNVVLQYPTQFANKYYDRMIATSAGKKPRLGEPTY